MFDADTLRVAGSGGCNRLSGQFEMDGDRLRFGPMVSTRMACPDDMDLERQFLEALAKVERYWVYGRFLVFLDSADIVSLRFEADGL